ncbi:MAG: hypothetical protein NC828_04915 [Candidatus Omnitrophica bacterium]|nr:hypothetical protein [Candidatus Omnitrophota bacterium]
MVKKDIFILGINDGHNASACILKNGEIIACVSEERFNRIKNYLGFPKESVNYCLNFTTIGPKDLDLVVLSWRNPITLTQYEKNKKSAGSKVILDKLRPIIFKGFQSVELYIPLLSRLYDKLYGSYSHLIWPYLNSVRRNIVSEYIGVEKEKVILIDHHLAHAYAAYYSGQQRDPALVFIIDGWGDDSCATLSVIKNGIFQKVSLTPNFNSLGMLYSAITEYLGMKPLEHEYKVMGLAPYASIDQINKTYEILKNLIWLDGLRFKTKFSSKLFLQFFRNALVGHRFDGVAGATQRIAEILLLEWIKKGIEMFKIDSIFCGGGVFLNVKANMLINELKEVKYNYFCPSPGDESTPIGAAYYGYKLAAEKNSVPFTPRPLANLYLGPEYAEDQIKKTLDESKIWEKGYKIRKSGDIEKEIAKLLKEEKIIARFSGRMEWGARALGNRSILAHPSNYDAIRGINEKIKSRDFWMPFAGTVLEERVNDYLYNVKNTPAPFMILAFNTKPLARRELKAIIHPYDFTIRPQILDKDTNPSYRKIIDIFHNITGIGAVLNTSFNLHGDPMVCSPQDALYTLTSSGLDYLVLENFIIEKI